MNALDDVAVLDQLDQERQNLRTSRLRGSLPVSLAHGAKQSPIDYITSEVNSLEVRRLRGLDIRHERDCLVDAAHATYLAMLDDDIEYEIDAETISAALRNDDLGILRRAIADCAIDYHIEARRSWRLA